VADAVVRPHLTALVAPTALTAVAVLTAVAEIRVIRSGAA
jgi:hypothetical protein